MPAFSCFTTDTVERIIPITLLPENDLPAWRDRQDVITQHWLNLATPSKTTRHCLIPDETGRLSRVLCLIPKNNGFFATGDLAFALPEGHYQFETDSVDLFDATLVFGLGAYQFTRYKKPTRAPAKLVLSKTIDQTFLFSLMQAIYDVRDLINTPTDDLGPSEFADWIDTFAKAHQATVRHIIGDALITDNYPLIHAVGRASDDAPRLVDLQWGDEAHPKLTLVGKGVCFDTGGLDLKNASNMLLMKKDMGGAAHVLGLARLIMEANLPVRLRVLIPMVENAVSGRAFRPGDVIRSRQGLTIEIGNTDAEGRLILADALTDAVSESPDLLINIATLTGAARVALGTECPAFFTHDHTLAEALYTQSEKTTDPFWRLPFFTPYRDALNSPIADLNNNGDAYGGAITAALFLNEFVPSHISWIHIDLMAWNLKSRPGRPQGGEAMGLRALWQLIRARYS